MPLYEYQCSKCATIFEIFAGMKDYPQEIPCCDCDGKAKKIISARGAAHSDNPSWLDDPIVQGSLQDTSSRKTKPIETRGELKTFMKRRGISESPNAGPRWF